jgi:poly [ADP-ribose] polymerase
MSCHPSSQELVTLVFDIERMKNAMLEFEIDLSKMPLGKLSRKQIEAAYRILTEAQDMIKAQTGSESKFLDASNRFFTLIPHDFGMRSPPLLDSPDLVKAKIEMLDNLLEIEIAYSLLAGGEKEKDVDPIDAHYKKLKTEVEVLDTATEEFKVIEEYVRNTHAATHTQFSLEIEQVFKVARKVMAAHSIQSHHTPRAGRGEAVQAFPRPPQPDAAVARIQVRAQCARHTQLFGCLNLKPPFPYPSPG